MEEGPLYGEVQCIMGNGQLGLSPPEENDRHLQKHCLPTTLLAGSNKFQTSLLLIPANSNHRANLPKHLDICTGVVKANLFGTVHGMTRIKIHNVFHNSVIFFEDNQIGR